MRIDINTPVFDTTYAFRNNRIARGLSVAAIANAAGLKREWLDRIDGGYGQILEVDVENPDGYRVVPIQEFFDRFYPVEASAEKPAVPPQVKKYFQIKE